jgi:hypothetical protein
VHLILIVIYRHKGAGGAISFLDETVYIMEGCNFSDCSSSGEKGGAIASFSAVNELFYITNCSFIGGSANGNLVR